MEFFNFSKKMLGLILIVMFSPIFVFSANLNFKEHMNLNIESYKNISIKMPYKIKEVSLLSFVGTGDIDEAMLFNNELPSPNQVVGQNNIKSDSVVFSGDRLYIKNVKDGNMKLLLVLENNKKVQLDFGISKSFHNPEQGIEIIDKNAKPAIVNNISIFEPKASGNADKFYKKIYIIDFIGNVIVIFFVLIPLVYLVFFWKTEEITINNKRSV
ncbi:hypothetical protein [Aquamicrobium sp.]|uniref:hypothetical protein n=1 Tax=Aquamicrobium sp. TaxID=1872579 RepID=UPI002589FB97|nr:hypothetical protein [Aquamicrobium sp.]MCK9550946.1 hypothetical protein [Aquamicrobium sp.]